MRDEEATFTSRPGLNLPVYQAGSIAGVIGITAGMRKWPAMADCEENGGNTDSGKRLAG